MYQRELYVIAQCVPGWQVRVPSQVFIYVVEQRELNSGGALRGYTDRLQVPDGTLLVLLSGLEGNMNWYGRMVIFCTFAQASTNQLLF